MTVCCRLGGLPVGPMYLFFLLLVCLTKFFYRFQYNSYVVDSSFGPPPQPVQQGRLGQETTTPKSSAAHKVRREQLPHFYQEGPNDVCNVVQVRALVCFTQLFLLTLQLSTMTMRWHATIMEKTGLGQTGQESGPEPSIGPRYVLFIYFGSYILTYLYTIVLYDDMTACHDKGEGLRRKWA